MLKKGDDLKEKLANEDDHFNNEWNMNVRFNG